MCQFAHAADLLACYVLFKGAYMCGKCIGKKKEGDRHMQEIQQREQHNTRMKHEPS